MEIVTRAEREDLARQVGSYIDPGILLSLVNRNHQVLYGRRGTGKSHVFAVLGARLREKADNLTVFVDLQKLGGVKQFANSEIPLGQRCFALYQDLLSWMVNSLSAHVVDLPANADKALEALDRLGRIATEPLLTERPKSRKVKATDKREAQRSIELGASSKSGFTAKGTIGGKPSTEREETTESVVVPEDVILYPDVHGVFDEFFRYAPRHVYLLLDEWSAVPLDVQPHLADFVKRALVPHKRVVVKIAALEQRSVFSERIGSAVAGLELGADVGPNVSLDEYYVYDRDPDAVTQLCADILFEHLRGDAAAHLMDVYGVTDGNGLIDAMFVSRDAFGELVESAEGVIRDLINVFAAAALGARVLQRDRIDREDVVEAARKWLNGNKTSELNGEVRGALEQLVDLVVTRGCSRYFLLPVKLQRHSIVDRLYDARVLHLVRSGFMDPADNRYYNVYAIDRAAYAHTGDPGDAESVPGFSHVGGWVRPFGPERKAIRRIELTEKALAAESETVTVGPLGDFSFTVDAVPDDAFESSPKRPANAVRRTDARGGRNDAERDEATEWNDDLDDDLTAEDEADREDPNESPGDVAPRS